MTYYDQLSLESFSVVFLLDAVVINEFAREFNVLFNILVLEVLIFFGVIIVVHVIGSVVIGGEK